MSHTAESIDRALDEFRRVGDCELPLPPTVTDAFITNPPHRVGIAHLICRPRFLLADPTGTGKSPQAIVAFAKLRIREPRMRMVVVAGKSSLFQWQAAVHQFLHDTPAVVIGFDDRRRPLSPDARHAAYATLTAPVLITTYAKLASDFMPLLRSLDVFALVLDEVQGIRGGLKVTKRADGEKKGSVLYPAAQKMAASARYVWGLSATPLYNGKLEKLEEIHAIFEVIREGTFDTLGSWRQQFLDRRLDQIRLKGGRVRRFYTVTGFKNLPELRRIIHPFYLKRPAAVMNAYLPSVVTREVKVEMRPDQRRIYEQVKAKHVINEQGVLDETIALVSMTYAQLACDAPHLLRMGESSCEKAVELRRLLTEEFADEKVILYTRYLQVVDWLSADALRGIPHVAITGRETAAQRERARTAFQLDQTGSAPRVILITSAGGQALDLQAASTVIFYDLPWSWGEFQQVVGRARRVGSAHAKVLVVLMANLNSIDEYTITRLTAKERTVESAMGLTVDEAVLTAPPPDALTLDELFRQLAAR